MGHYENKKSDKHDKTDIPFFSCGNYHGNRDTCKSTHYLRADAIEQVVTLKLRKMTKFLQDDEEAFAALLADKTNKDLVAQKKHRENELQKSVARHKSVENLYERLYEDNISGKVSDEWFMQLSHKYEVERMKPKEKISALHREISELDGISQCYGWTITLIGAASSYIVPSNSEPCLNLFCNPYNKGILVYSPTHSGYTSGRYHS